MRKVKDFSAALYNTGRYGVETRGGKKVEELAVKEYGVVAKIPEVVDCRGRCVYGFLSNGRWKAKGKDAFDLVLVKV